MFAVELFASSMSPPARMSISTIGVVMAIEFSPKTFSPMSMLQLFFFSMWHVFAPANVGKVLDDVEAGGHAVPPDVYLRIVNST